jgi:hypothetical protein
MPLLFVGEVANKDKPARMVATSDRARRRADCSASTCFALFTTRQGSATAHQR